MTASLQVLSTRRATAPRSPRPVARRLANALRRAIIVSAGTTVVIPRQPRRRPGRNTSRSLSRILSMARPARAPARPTGPRDRSGPRRSFNRYLATSTNGSSKCSRALADRTYRQSDAIAYEDLPVDQSRCCQWRRQRPCAICISWRLTDGSARRCEVVGILSTRGSSGWHRCVEYLLVYARAIYRHPSTACFLAIWRNLVLPFHLEHSVTAAVDPGWAHAHQKRSDRSTRALGHSAPGTRHSALAPNFIDRVSRLHQRQPRPLHRGAEAVSYCAIPSISALAAARRRRPAPSAESDRRRRCERIGLQTVRVEETPGHPLVYGERLDAPRQAHPPDLRPL